MDDDLFVESALDEYRSICISTLARSVLAEEDVSHLGNDSGYYIYEVDKRPLIGGIVILAKAASSEAAMRLIEMWRRNSSVIV